MALYHLLATRRNADGSFDTPSIDELVAAPDDKAAVDEAVRFPLHRFTGTDSIMWLVDEGGQLVWTRDVLQAA